MASEWPKALAFLIRRLKYLAINLVKGETPRLLFLIEVAVVWPRPQVFDHKVKGGEREVLTNGVPPHVRMGVLQPPGGRLVNIFLITAPWVAVSLQGANSERAGGNKAVRYGCCGHYLSRWWFIVSNRR